MSKVFTVPFTGNAYEGDSITGHVDGFELTATIYRDDSSESPWDRECGHGPVSDWRSKDSKAPGELILNSDRDGTCRFYDFAEACRHALREGWGADGDEGMTPRQKAAHAARADFERLRAWCRDDWTYVGVAVTVTRRGVPLTGQYDHALWGIESDSAGHLTDTAEEFAGEALEAARATLATLAEDHAAHSEEWAD